MAKVRSKGHALNPLDTSHWACVPLVLFLVLFPKGGFKVDEIPVTWGYILIAVFATTALPWAILDRSQLRISPLTLFALACLVPFQCILIISLLHGVDSLGVAFSTLLNFCILPFVLLLVWRRWYRDRTLALTLRILRFCVFAAALYGIAVFVIRLVTGKMIEVPLLTVNIADYGTIADKFNMRYNLVMKLVSTYNNGNVYGASTILFLPLFDHLEKHRSHRILVRIALLLTLSRTAWIGLIADQMLSLWPKIRQVIMNLPVLPLRRFRQVALPVVSIFVIAALVVILAISMPGGFDMLTDSTLGGRIETLNSIRTITLFPSQPFQGFSEMVFLSALGQLGLVGFLLMVNLFFCPLWFGVIDPTLRMSPLRQAAVKGLFLYGIIAWSDGAIEFIPVMCFYWFTMVVAIYGREDLGDVCRANPPRPS